MAVTTNNVIAGTGGIVTVNNTYGWIVGPTGKPLAGTSLANGVPNATVTDSTTSAQQVWFATIPGNVLSTTAQIMIDSFWEFTGNDSKNVIIRVGPTSGTFATATPIGGQTGLTTQKSIGSAVWMWNSSSIASQYAMPAAMASPYSSNSAVPLTLNIDTSLDWNIYWGWQSGVLTGAPQNSGTLRKFNVILMAS